MNKENLKNLINESRRKQDSKSIALLTFILGEFEAQEIKGNKVAVDQIVHKAIESNRQCNEARPDPKYEEENNFLKSLLPSYLSVAELNTHLKPLGLDSSGKSMGAAIKYLRSNGLEFLPEDVKTALTN